MLDQQENKSSSGNGLKSTETTEALFSSVIALVCGGEFSGIVDLAEAIFNQLTGNSDAPNPNYTAALNQLSSQISNIQNYLSNLATSVVYQEQCTNITNNVTEMQTNSGYTAANLDYDQVNAMCTFLSPGASPDNQPDYYSSINNLLSATYGVSVTIQSLQENTNQPLGMDLSSQAYAIASDGAGGPEGQGFYDFVQAQVNLSVAVGLMIASISNTANQVYNCLSNQSNQTYWLNEFSDDQGFSDNLKSTLSGATMLADVSNPSSSTYLTDVLGKYIINAPQSLCGNLFSTVADMNYNLTNYQWNNPSFAMTNPNAADSYINAAQYVPQQPEINLNIFGFGPMDNNTTWMTPSFYNNQPGNQILLQDPCLATQGADNNYFYFDTQDYPYQPILWGNNYPNAGLNSNTFELEWIVYMSSFNNIYSSFYNPTTGYAISAFLFYCPPNPYNDQWLCISIQQYDYNDSNQKFQLLFEEDNE